MELGIALTLVAAVGWGAGDVFARKALFNASETAVLASMIALTALSLGLVGLVLKGPGAFVGLGLRFFALAVVMGLLTWVLGNLMNFHAMQRAGVVITAPILGAVPLPAIFLAVTLGGERPDVWVIVGAITIVGGVIVLLTDRDRVLR